MTDGPLRDRGLKAVVDTTEVAEFDIAGYQVSDAALWRIAGNLAEVTHSPRDRVVGDVRVRELEGMDVMFALGREPGAIVVTIIGLRPPDPTNPTERLLKRAGDLAMFRGVTGL